MSDQGQHTKGETKETPTGELPSQRSPCVPPQDHHERHRENGAQLFHLRKFGKQTAQN